MVDKMMKYSFILLSGETEDFLNRIQELGVVDVTRSARPVDERSAAMMASAAADKKVIGKLEGLDFSKDADHEAILGAREKAELDTDLTSGAQKALVELGELELAYAAATKEVSARKPWGDFDKERIEQLDSLGYAVRYYRIPVKKFSQEWAELYPLEVINEDKANVWFVTIAPKAEDYSFPVEPVSAPEGSWKEAQAEVERLQARIAGHKGLIMKYQDALPQMQEAS